MVNTSNIKNMKIRNLALISPRSSGITKFVTDKKSSKSPDSKIKIKNRLKTVTNMITK